MIARALAGVLALWSVAAASVTDVRVDAYREAASAGAVGTVTGHAREERLKPGDVERPLLGTVVTLVPYSPALLARFEEIRTHARDSANAYRASGRAIRLAREAYEKALWEAGAPDFVRASVVDATGGFRMEDLPAGAWLLIATRSVVVDRDGLQRGVGLGTRAHGLRGSDRRRGADGSKRLVYGDRGGARAGRRPVDRRPAVECYFFSVFASFFIIPPPFAMIEWATALPSISM